VLRVAEQWFASDVGRQRQGNEDNFFVQSPLFVVADGMGGAQAGEVASELAVEAFRGGVGDGAPEERLVAIIQHANRAIHDKSRSDAAHQGMGTTCTAIYVAEAEVVLAHVGDSRAYLFRDGDLTRLTHDHSLVGELVDRGKLTEEQAEVHPQRNVITRALGPEADVEVDTERIEARSGDVFLICSDGLTSMIREAQVLPILREHEDLEAAGRALIAAANEAGGRDNITVILVRLEEVQVARGRSDDDQTDEYEDFAPSTRAEAPTRVGQVEPAQPAGPTTSEASPRAPATADVAAAVKAADEAEAEYRRQGTVALPAITPAQSAPPPKRTAPLPPPREPVKPPKRGRKRRLPRVAIFVVIGLAIVLVAAFVAIRAVFFVGLDQHRVVTIFRGVPYDLPLGIELYSRHYSSGVTIDQVSPARRGTFTDHKLRSLDDAADLVRQLETGRISG
jgi:serine/threonine protein phosphatase PrpC